jgi:UDPglucose 6-dehydrogenase|tara:strand:- start:215 stop:1051 length:837 start_codon:yes stop_codon:yes gene_type:complete
MKLGIVGHGFVGKAVDFAFTHPSMEKTIVDPVYNTDISILSKTPHDVVFVCVPTPTNAETGYVDATIVKETVDYLVQKTNTDLIVIKSTVTPDIVGDLITSHNNPNIIYNPEFLTERSANEEFVNADYHIIGGSHDASNKLINLYKRYSMCEALHYVIVTPQEASFIKYACNSFLATKVSFFNQLYDLCQDYNCSYNSVMKGVTLDRRIGSSHTKVPGYDLKRGFGGACLPKDTLAFLKFSQDNMSLLQTVLDINNSIRKQYELDEREKVNKITFTNH